MKNELLKIFFEQRKIHDQCQETTTEEISKEIKKNILCVNVNVTLFEKKRLIKTYEKTIKKFTNKDFR